MSLNKFHYLYSVGTDAFYDTDEQYMHKRLLKLYKLRQVEKSNDSRDWKLKSINRLIRKQKEQLTILLDRAVEENRIRNLNENCLNNKSVINLFSSDLTRNLELEPLELTKDLLIVRVFFFQVFNNLVHQGFMYNGEHYIFLTSSAGQIRTKRAVFIRESAYERVRLRMMCGLTVEDINEAGGINPNKFLAYLALMNSATDVWEDFDIDKSIVVDDFETNVQGLVDHINSTDYSITREIADTPIPHMDGCGIMLDGPTRMVRMPWIKGLLVQFPYDKFLTQCCTQDQWIVTDIYGTKHNVILEDIRYIFTKSQFKLYKYYPSWECYKARFKAYGCKAAYCNIEESYIPKARINYQMLQTLSDIKDEEIDKILKRTIAEIDNIGLDYQTTMRLLGATDYNTNKSAMQEALIIYPELFKDAYSREILKQTKKSLVKQAKGGRLRVNGKYLFISPDLYAFCEWLFKGEQNPKGLLNDGEVYTKEFRDGDELACLRSPHLYREWAVRRNKRDKELDRWFGGTKCVYTSCHDLISRFLMFDCDGDKALVVKDRTLTTVAKRNMKDIVPLSYDLKKAKGGILSADSLYEGMCAAYTGGNIGPISNNITKVWNSGEIGEEQLNVVKWLCLYNNAVIDYAKTLWKPEPPAAIAKIIQSYTRANVPHFFIYAKDKEEYQVEQPVENTVMARIVNRIPSSKVKYCKTIGKFDYRMLMRQDAGCLLNEGNSVIKSYDYWNTHQHLFNEDNDNCKDDDLYIYKLIKQRIYDENKDVDADTILNTIVMTLYSVRKSSTKKMLWGCFGKEMVENLKINLIGNDRVCPICGKRFNPIRGKQDIYCGPDCQKQAKKQQLEIFYESPKPVTFNNVEN